MKKLLSIVLSIAMLVTMISTMAFSASADTVTDVLYTFSEGSRPSSLTSEAYVTKRAGRTSYEDLEDGDHGYVLKTVRKTTNDIQDQALCIKLPADIWTSHSNPSALSFDIKTDTGEMRFGNKVYLNSSAAGKDDTSFGVSMWSVNSTWKTVSISLTTSAATSAIENNYLWLCMKNVYGTNTANYLYVDNVSITYEGSSAPVDPYEDIAGTTDAKAQLRIGNNNGIRFITNVDTDLVQDAKDDGYTVTMGTLIAPLTTGELTHDKNVLDIPTDGWYAHNEGEIAASIVNIKDANITKEFVARGYITLTKGNESTTYYATQPNEGRSLKTLAAYCIADTSENAFFSKLNDEQQEQVTAWANAQ